MEVVEFKTIVFYEDELITVKMDMPSEWQMFKPVQKEEAWPTQGKMDL